MPSCYIAKHATQGVLGRSILGMATGFPSLEDSSRFFFPLAFESHGGMETELGRLACESHPREDFEIIEVPCADVIPTADEMIAAGVSEAFADVYREPAPAPGI